MTSVTLTTSDKKDPFKIYNAQYAVMNLNTIEAKKILKSSAKNICLEIEKSFSSKSVDRLIFNMPDLLDRSGFKDERTVLTSLAQINKEAIFLIRPLEKELFIIFTPKIENLVHLTSIDSNNDTEILWLQKNTIKINKKVKKANKGLSKLKSLFSGIVKKHVHAENSHGFVENSQNNVKYSHEHAYLKWLNSFSVEYFEQVHDTSLDLIFLNPNINKSSSFKEISETEVKKSEQEIKVTEVSNAAEFSKFEKEEEEIRKARESFYKPLKAESDSKTTNTKKEVPLFGVGVDKSKNDVDNLVDLACSVKYKGNSIILDRKAIKTTIENHIKTIGITRTTELVTNQVEWFTYRTIDESRPGGCFNNCLKENRPQPTSYAQEKARAEDAKFLTEYLPIAEIWQGHTNDIKNGSQAKNTIMTYISKSLSDIKAFLKMSDKNIRDKVKPSEDDIKEAEKLKVLFAEKFKKSKEYTGFSIIANIYQKSLTDLNLMGVV